MRERHPHKEQTAQGVQFRHARELWQLDLAQGIQRLFNPDS
jgi:hypothetical protein